MTPPQRRRGGSLPRLPLVDDGFTSGADASSQAVLCESEPTAKNPQSLVVVVRDRRQRSRADRLPAEPPVVPGHELLRGGSRSQSPGPTEHGFHGEVCRESARPYGGPQCADVNEEFLGQLVKRQSLFLSLVLNDRIAGTLQDRAGDHSSPAIPWTERLERNREECGKLALAQTDRTT